MRLGLFLVFAAIPFLEIALLIKVGQAIGFWPTLMLIGLSAAFGAYVIYEQGFQVLGRAADALNRGRPPVAPVVNGLFILFAGLLLIVPGFLTDAAGLALLFPRIRHRFAVWVLKRIMKSAEMRGFVFRSTGQAGAAGRGTGARGAPPQDGPGNAARGQPSDGPIIEGEFERLDERTVDSSRTDARSGR